MTIFYLNEKTSQYEVFILRFNSFCCRYLKNTVKSPFVGKHSKKFPDGIEVDESRHFHTTILETDLMSIPPPVWYVRERMWRGGVDLHRGEALREGLL